MLLVTAIGVLVVIAIHKGEPANLYPTPNDAVSEHKFTQPLLTETLEPRNRTPPEDAALALPREANDGAPCGGRRRVTAAVVIDGA